jgi:hypothetical protein
VDLQVGVRAHGVLLFFDAEHLELRVEPLRGIKSLAERGERFGERGWSAGIRLFAGKRACGAA